MIVEVREHPPQALGLADALLGQRPLVVVTRPAGRVAGVGVAEEVQGDHPAPIIRGADQASSTGRRSAANRSAIGRNWWIRWPSSVNTSRNAARRCSSVPSVFAGSG